MERKWVHIREIAVWLICIGGLVTCHGIDQHTKLETKELEIRKIEAQVKHDAIQLEKKKLGIGD